MVTRDAPSTYATDNGNRRATSWRSQRARACLLLLALCFPNFRAEDGEAWNAVERQRFSMRTNRSCKVRRGWLPARRRRVW